MSILIDMNILSFHSMMDRASSILISRFSISPSEFYSIQFSALERSIGISRDAIYIFLCVLHLNPLPFASLNPGVHIYPVMKCNTYIYIYILMIVTNTVHSHFDQALNQNAWLGCIAFHYFPKCPCPWSIPRLSHCLFRARCL